MFEGEKMTKEKIEKILGSKAKELLEHVEARIKSA